MTKIGQKRTTPKRGLKKGRKAIGQRGLQRKADRLFSLAVREKDVSRYSRLDSCCAINDCDKCKDLAYCTKLFGMLV